MVLSEKEKLEKDRAINQKPYNYMVLDTSHIRYRENGKKFTLAVEMLNICNYVNWGNEIFKKVNASYNIELSIIYKAMDAVLKDEGFNQEDLLTYFTVRKEIEEYALLIQNFSDFNESLWFPEIDLMLAGLSLKKQSSLEIEKWEKIVDQYAKLFDDFTENNIEVNDFKIKVEKLIQD